MHTLGVVHCDRNFVIKNLTVIFLGWVHFNNILVATDGSSNHKFSQISDGVSKVVWKVLSIPSIVERFVPVRSIWRKYNCCGCSGLARIFPQRRYYKQNISILLFPVYDQIEFDGKNYVFVISFYIDKNKWCFSPDFLHVKCYFSRGKNDVTSTYGFS